MENLFQFSTFSDIYINIKTVKNLRSHVNKYFENVQVNIKVPSLMLFNNEILDIRITT